MEEIIKYLFENSDQRQCFYNTPRTLVLSFGAFYLHISFSQPNKTEEDFLIIEDFKSIQKLINKNSISGFKISLSEFLGDRKDSVLYNEEDEKYYYDDLPTSIVNSIMSLVRQLKNLNKDLVNNYEFEINDPGGGYCDLEPNFDGNIYLNLLEINFENIKELVEILNNINLVQIPCYYCISFIDNNTPKNTFKAQFLNTNTKVRRLGYIKLFSSFIHERKKIPEKFLNIKFEDYSQSYTIQLQNLDHNKGIIQNFKGKSAEPYIDLLRQMDLITSVNKLIVPTKWLKTYLALKENLKIPDHEIFSLNKLDKLFFLELILKKDFLYLSIILEYIYINGDVAAQDLIKKFKSLLLERLSILIKQSYGEKKILSELKVIENRVKEWKSAEVYLEHIIMPRANWLVDLELVELKNNIVSINENGKRLCIELFNWIDISTEYIADSTDFLRKFYPRIFLMTYTGNCAPYPSKEEIVSNIEDNLEESFRLFKTLAPNRVTSSQAIIYSKYKTLLNYGYSLSDNFHEKILNTVLFNKYIYKFQPQYNDGYIQKIKN